MKQWRKVWIQRDWLWVRSPLEEVKYSFKFIFSSLWHRDKNAALSSSTHHAMPPVIGGKYGTECLNTSYSVNLIKKIHKKTYLNVSKLFGNRFYVIAISDMYHPITTLHTSFFPIRAVTYKQLPPIDTIALLLYRIFPYTYFRLHELANNRYMYFAISMLTWCYCSN